ncbi:MAG: peptidoglycan DD-metalloendopeptidase family protein [Patescibacteria group bacterium]|nr:peptidoglycan DD-metalloendopeptidase family protein [Patescibacteria group bacterium]
MNIMGNKNKNESTPPLSVLVILFASFLLALPLTLIAQSDANSNTNATANTNSTNSLTDWEEGAADDATLRELNKDLDAKRKAIEELQKRTQMYEQNIKIKQQETVTLKNQLSILDLQIEQTQASIDTTKEEINALNIELEFLTNTIAAKEVELTDTKEILSAYLRLINQYDDRTALEVLVANSSFSDFYDQMQYTQNLESKVKDSLIEIKKAKNELDQQKTTQESKKKELNELADQLAASVVDSNSQKDYKTILLADTKESEQKFEELLEQARREQESAQAEIQTLESKAREKLQDEGVDLNIDAALMWPVNPSKGISAYFHDTTYPFRKYFEHPAIDVPTDQGTVVRAAENGYIVRAKNAGLGYSYVMVVHNEKISTVYGHLSRIDVAEDDYVVRGQQIGLSGGLPGTPGAGGLSTGAHLHFEVRSGGIPVNPLDYLPSL